MKAGKGAGAAASIALVAVVVFGGLMVSHPPVVSSLLVPSQARRSKPGSCRSNHHPHEGPPVVVPPLGAATVPFLVPSQARSSSALQAAAESLNEEPPPPLKSSTGGKRERRRRRTTEPSNRAAANPNKNPTNAPQPNKKTTHHHHQHKSHVKTGNLPDIHWRAVSMKHLRTHPSFRPLPLPTSIRTLDHLEEIRQFRQESWQWDVVHAGRCTTSQAVAALGLLNTKAGKRLGVPKSWLRGGTNAYYRLKQPSLRTLEEMNDALCRRTEDDDEDEEEDREDAPHEQPPRLWIHPHHHHNSANNHTTTTTTPKYNHHHSFPFAAKLLHKTSDEEWQQRRNGAQKYNNGSSSQFMSVRMNWGNAQEATSVLTALNYFTKIDPTIVIQEVGMCGAGLQLNVTAAVEEDADADSSSSLLVGATPDGLIRYPNGTVEVLEVKNHCPFVSSTTSYSKNYPPPTTTNKANQSKRFRLRDMPFDETRTTVPPVYIPQLMMEMFCVGPNCRSAVMVRQTATRGAAVLRLPRSDAWIAEMLYWLHRFQSDYVDANVEPPSNFFWDDDDSPTNTTTTSSSSSSDRYRTFVEDTRKLCDQVQLLDLIPHREIQRVMSANETHTSLFLD